MTPTQKEPGEIAACGGMAEVAQGATFPAPRGRRQLDCRRRGSVRHASSAPESQPEQKAGHVEKGEQDAR